MPRCPLSGSFSLKADMSPNGDVSRVGDSLPLIADMSPDGDVSLMGDSLPSLADIWRGPLCGDFRPEADVNERLCFSTYATPCRVAAPKADIMNVAMSRRDKE